MRTSLLTALLLLCALGTNCGPRGYVRHGPSSPSPGHPSVFITGQFTGAADLNPGPGVELRVDEAGGYFLDRLDASDGHFVKAWSWDGTRSYWDTGVQIAIDKEVNVYVAGYFKGTVDLDPGETTDAHVSKGDLDVFLAKYDRDGVFQWARTFGGPLEDKCRGLAVDPEGDAFVSGSFKGTADFDPGPGVQESTSQGDSDAFLCRFDPDGNFVWAQTWGGPGPDWATGMGIGAGGIIYDTGSYSGSARFDLASKEPSVSNGRDDVFVLGIDTNGVESWFTCWGGAGDDRSYGVALDSLGDAWITGGFQDTVDFNPQGNPDMHISNGDYDIFLTLLDRDGKPLRTRTWGGTGSDIAWENYCDSQGNQYVTGWFEDTVDFDPGPDVKLVSSSGAHDGFLSKFNPSGEFLWVETWGAGGNDEGHAVVVDPDDYIYLAGVFHDKVDLDPGLKVEEHTASGSGVFLEKLDPSGTIVWVRTWDGEGKSETE